MSRLVSVLGASAAIASILAACSANNDNEDVRVVVNDRLGRLDCSGFCPPTIHAVVETCAEAQAIGIATYCAPLVGGGVFPYQFPDGHKECWCSGGSDPGPIDAGPEAEAGPACKTCNDFGETACGQFDNGCGSQITCTKCPAGGICDLGTSTCTNCGQPPDNTPGYSNTPPVVGDKFEVPFGKTICKAVGKIPYVGNALVTGAADPKIRIIWTRTSTENSTGLQNCSETVQRSDSNAGALEFCAVTASFSRSSSAKRETTKCQECVDGKVVCGPVSCTTNTDSSGWRGSLTRKVGEKTGLGSLIRCPPGDAACGEVADWLTRRFEIEVEGSLTGSVSGKDSLAQTSPGNGNCALCTQCTEAMTNAEPRVTATAKGKFKVVLLDAGRWGKLAAAIAVGGFVGASLGATNTIKSGACGADNCMEVYGIHFGGFVEFEIQAFRYEKTFSWIARCEARLGGKVCNAGGVEPTPDFNCSVNDGSVFDIGAE